jgi:hypothetical protein
MIYRLTDVQYITELNRKFDEDFRVMEQMLLLDTRKQLAEHRGMTILTQ